MGAPSKANGNLLTRAIVVTSLEAAYASVSQVLASAGFMVDQYRSVDQAADVTIRENVATLLITADRDWRRLLKLLHADAARPAVILLLRVFDGKVWSDALQSGVFDALPVTSGRDRLLSTVTAGLQRWERRQLVLAALAQNPLVQGEQGEDCCGPFSPPPVLQSEAEDE